ncbi:prostatic acid phosphatase [Patella vulgata]|uniref:prostatic acid phosphatase n=1 Tax=Patella vulgata TaxID=6465 RepID=UPI00217FC1C8|nr:prostatic acid phosphatase [Patella vulgata]
MNASSLLSVIFFLSVNTLVYNVDPDGELKLVLALFRHGDRAPIQIYPKDENGEDKWPLGLGQLTEKGHHDAYNLGKYFWKRYGEQLKLKQVYKANSPEFHIRSTSIDRAKLSAAYFLAGFYNLVMDKAEEFITSVHIPFTPESQDQLLSMTGCPKEEELRRNYLTNSSKFKKYNDGIKMLYPTISHMAGNRDDPVDMIKFGHIVDAVYCELKHNMSQPDVIKQNLKTLMEWFNSSRRYYGAPTPEIIRIKTGPLVSKMVKSIENKVTHPDSLDKIFLYSAHDTNVISLLSGLGCFNDIQPPYSSAVILELRKVDDMYYVHVLYHNDSNIDPHPCSIPGCDDKKCALSDFKREMKKVMMSTTEREKTCVPTFKSKALSLSDNVIPITIAVVLLVCLILSIIMYRMYKRPRRPRGDPMMYRPLAYGDDDDDEDV